MEKMSKEEILEIGNNILLESDVVATHGTSVSNGLSILEKGFKFNRTSFIMQSDVINLCTYGWYENEKGNACNVVISIPKSFIKDLYGFDDNKYDNWIKYIKENDYRSDVINSLSDMEMYGPIFSALIPKEFIKGMFVYTDDKNYLSFDIDHKEEGLNYLTYIDNPNYYDNLDEEAKLEFISEMKKKIFDSKKK